MDKSSMSGAEDKEVNTINEPVHEISNNVAV